MTALGGRVALVTGASRGIGLAIANELQAAGAHVIRLARSLEPASLDQRTDVPCDVTDPSQVERAAQRILTGVRAPDIVVNSAGAFTLKPFLDTTTREFVREVAVNLTGPFLILRALLPAMVERGGGHVVTIGSVADHQSFPGNSAYGASKFGLRGLHQVLAMELARQGIRATLVSPAATDTSLWDHLDPDARNDLPHRDQMLLPQDVAEAVLFAVSRPARVNVELIRLAPAPASDA